MNLMAQIHRNADACQLAQTIYERDMDRVGSIAPAWHTLTPKTKDVYVQLAAAELDKHKVVFFPAPAPVHPSELVPHAIRSIESAIVDLVNAANAARTEAEAVELQDVIKDLTVQLNAASMVAWHRESSFFPKGA